ncbi:MAG: hypothetical protein KDC10_11920, partial [Calditrichaeota bacterium]|nr:hypothetical protein [Calditrichota bacterium]
MQLPYTLFHMKRHQEERQDGSQARVHRKNRASHLVNLHQWATGLSGHWQDATVGLEAAGAR